MHRITFSPNGLTPFIWKGLKGIETYQKAVERFHQLAKFDLGLLDEEEIRAVFADYMIKAYKAYRRKYAINSPDSIVTSVATIDQFDEKSNTWFVVSDTGDEEPSYEIGEQLSYQGF